MRLRRCALFLLYICATLAAAGQPAMFKKYMAADGLSDNTVLCAMRDSYGFLWLGTNNGLNCFDGTQNTVYRNMVEQSAGFENNIITAVFEHEGDIWFGGAFGLYVYHRDNNRFGRFDRTTRYGVCISSTVTKIVQAPGGSVWIGTLGQGVFIYNPSTGELLQDSRHGSFYSDIVATPDRHVYLASLQGEVVVCSDAGDYLRQYTIPDYASDKNTIALEYADGALYVGSDRGLYRIRNGQDAIERLPLTGTQGLTIRDLSADANHQLLLGTERGIYRLDLGDMSLSRLDNPLSSDAALSDDVVNGLMWDADSTLWVMTAMGGICYMPAHQSPVSMLSTGTGGDDRKRMVHALCEMPDGRLMVGSDEGLQVYDPQSQSLSRDGLPHFTEEVNVLMADGDDLWIGTRHDGIYVLSTATGQMRHYQYSADRPYTITSNEVNALLRTRQGDIYVGTSWSLCRFDRQTENFMWFAEIGSMTNVTSLCEDSHGCVWAASSNHGLFRQTAPRAGFQNYTYDRERPGSITSNYVTTVGCDHEGTVWIATNGNGLCRYRPEDDTFERFGAQGSVVQDQQIYFIVEDLQHNLWMGAENGMVKIDAQRDAGNMQVLKAPGNLTRQQKPHNAAVITRRGELFAGRNGVLAHFFPDKITITEKRPPVYITGITLPHRAEGDRHLDGNFYGGGTLALPFADNSFTLHFSSPRFTGDTDVRFEYMLSGVDQTWARGTKNAEATYANVPPGKYEFLLREAGNDREEGCARLQITILPPWYRTTLAYFVYTLLLLAAIFMAVRSYSRRLSRRYNRRMEQFQRQQEKENFESKISFFINLVHEIRTPLTLMSLPLDAIEEQTHPQPLPAREGSGVGQHIAAIRRNMNYLLGITNQLLDFQKAERGRVELDLQKCDVGELLSEAYRQFEDAMQVQGKQLQLQLPEEPVVAVIDREKLLKVLMNLLGNAFKYAKSEVILRLEQTDDNHFCISVIDDGPGIPEQERNKIFDVYHQIAGDATAKHLGTGLGLAYARMLARAHGGELTVSEPHGGGSEFRLILSEKGIVKSEEFASAALSEKGIVKSEEFASAALSEKGIVTERNSSLFTFPSSLNYRLLIVEDNEELLQMTTDALRQHYRIVKARDGVEALDVLRHQDIDVIVSDVMMPRMDGTELTRRVKQDINTSHIPVILLTAKTSVEAKLEGMESGADVYLEKPFSAKQLHLQIASLLRMRQNFHERMRQIDGSSAATAALAEGELGLTQQDLQFVERLQRMVAENMRDEEFSIDLLAEQMNMSRSSFYRKIKALTDMTPIEYLKAQRLERAAQLLRRGDRITEVAEQVGFTSSSYFAKCFKARFGVLPKDFQTGKTATQEAD